MKLLKKGIIVDTTVFHKFVDVNHEDSKLIHKYIKNQTLKLVYGNDEKSKEEIKKDNRMLKMVKLLTKRKVTHETDSKEKKREIDDNRGIVKGIKLKSWTNYEKTDAHIIAIALVEKKARLLFSSEGKKGDNNLQKDFTNSNIINNPKGNIYKNKSHEHLLQQ